MDVDDDPEGRSNEDVYDKIGDDKDEYDKLELRGSTENEYQGFVSPPDDSNSAL